MTYIPINTVNEKEKIAKEEKVCFERVFRSTDGEVILKVLGNNCMPDMGYYEPDSHKMAFNEGKRNIFLMLLRLASIPIDDFMKKYEILKAKRDIEEYEWNKM